MPDDPKVTFSFGALAELFRNSYRVTAILWRERKGSFLGLMVTMILLSAAPFAQSGVFALLINTLTEHTAVNLGFDAWLVGLITLFLFLSALPTALGQLQGYLHRLFYYYLGEKFEFMILKKRAELDVAVHEDPKNNDLLSKINEGSNYRIQNFSDRQFYLLQNIIEVVIAATIIIIAQWWLFLILLVATLPQLFVEARFGNQIWGVYGAQAEVRRRYWNLRDYFEHISSLVELRLFQNVPYFLTWLSRLFRQFQDEQKEKERVKFLYELGAIAVSQSAIVFAIFWFVREVVQGALLIGTMVFLLTSINALRQALAGLFMNLGKQYGDSLFITDFFRFMVLPNAVVKPVNGIVLAPNETPEIIFENVSFSYPGTDTLILRNVNLTIAPGEKLAIIGINGAGKTTFVKLLCRFYDPTEGRILVGGHDLRDIDLESWYSHMSTLFQEYAKYQVTVSDIIRFGRTSGALHDQIDKSLGGPGNTMPFADMPKAMSEKIEQAAQSSESDAFIQSFEKQYDQMLGKVFTNGVDPSIGQWQKLALARMFYRDARILVLDEPTSSIDAEAEMKIFEKLEQLPKDHSVILISHRFSTVRTAQRICVFEKGTVSELGTHEELLKKKGTYARLFALQAKGYQ